MNDQTGVRATVFNCLENLIEWHDDVFEVAEIKLQRQKRTCHAPRNSDHTAAQRIAKIDILIWIWALGIGRWDFSDKNWPISIAHARSEARVHSASEYLPIDVGIDNRGDQFCFPPSHKT